MEDAGEGWWHCPSPLLYEIIDGPTSHPSVMPSSKLWLVRTDPLIEWHGDESFIEVCGPDHPLAHPIDPTPYALVGATGREPPGPIDPTILDAGVAAGPALIPPTPTSVADARTLGGLWMKVILRVLPGSADGLTPPTGEGLGAFHSGMVL
jgi:hypothetical protein